MPACRLIEVIHADRRLFLVFEFLDLDLKKHLDTNPLICGDKKLIKVTAGPSTLACHDAAAEECLHTAWLL